MLRPRPTVGQSIVVRGHTYVIFAVYSMGTCDVEAPDGRCFRVTGLPWL